MNIHQNRKDRELADWAAKGSAQRQAQQLDAQLRAYAKALPGAPVFSDGAAIEVEGQKFALPRAINMPGNKAELICGLPALVGCCDHGRPAKDFIVSGGVVMGLCGKAGYVFRQTRKQLGREISTGRLITHEERAVAEEVAAHERNEHVDARSSHCPRCWRR